MGKFIGWIQFLEIEFSRDLFWGQTTRRPNKLLKNDGFNGGYGSESGYLPESALARLSDFLLSGNRIRSPGGPTIDDKMLDIKRDNGYKTGSLPKYRQIPRIRGNHHHDENRPQKIKFLGTKSDQEIYVFNQQKNHG